MVLNKFHYLIVALGVLLLTAPTGARILYVDKDQACPGSGTSGSPYCTIQRAFDNVAAGDTIRIRNSSSPYNENAVATRSGTSTAPIVVEPDLGHNPILRNTVNPGQQRGAIEINGADYWTIRNLTFDGAGLRTSLYAIEIRPLQISNPAARPIKGHKIIGNTIKNWGGPESFEYSLSIQVGTNTPGGHETSDLEISHNILENNRNRAINVGTVRNALIENNDISGQRCGKTRCCPGAGYIAYVSNGIHVTRTNSTGSPAIIIRNNYIHDFAPPSDCSVPLSTPHWIDAIWSDVLGSDGEAYGNIIENIAPGSGHGTGIHIESRCNNWKVHNNVISNVGGNGLKVRNGNDNVFENNTVYQAGTGIFIRDGARAIFKNNIIQDSRNAQVFIHDLAITDGGHILDHNLYYDSDGNNIGKFGTNGSMLSLAQWQNQSGFDANSIVANPLFISTQPDALDFHLKSSSPAIDAGIDVGIPFKGSAPDLGAYETGTDPDPEPEKIHPIPGIVEVEDYGNGGQDVSWHDTSPADNKGSEYRTDGVDIKVASGSGGYIVGWTADGEWLKYSVEVISTTLYDITVHAANGGTADAQLRLEGAGMDETVDIAPTNGWIEEQDFTMKNIQLTQGTHTLTLTIVKGPVDINWIEFNVPANNTSPHLRVNTGPLAMTVFPESFQSSAKIDFNLSKSSNVSLAAYNVKGERVAGLLQRRLAQGNYTVKWDTRSLSSGVYVLQLKAGDNTVYRKLLRQE